MRADGDIETRNERREHPPPPPAPCQGRPSSDDCRNRARGDRCVVHDRIPPGHDLLERQASSLVSHIEPIDGGPQVDSEPQEVASEVSGRGVPTVHVAAERQTGLDQPSDRDRCLLGDERRRFGVQVPSKALKLRRQRHDVRAIKLLGQPLSPGAGPCDPAMHLLKLFEARRPRRVPDRLRLRRHGEVSLPGCCSTEATPRFITVGPVTGRARSRADVETGRCDTRGGP